MSQDDIIKFLSKQRKINNHRFFSVQEIKKGLKEEGKSNGVIRGVSNDLFKLTLYGMIEWRGKGIWYHQKLFRAKK